MVEEPKDEMGNLITEDIEITKYRLAKIEFYRAKILEYLEKKGGKQENFKSFVDGTVSPVWVLQEAAPGAFDKAIAELKQAIITEAQKL